MGKNFDFVCETVVSRNSCGGLILGDFVKFRPGYKNTPTYKAMPTPLQVAVDDLATCGLNIKVMQVGDKLSGASAGNQFKTADNVVITIAADHGGGRTYNHVTVSLDMIDMVDIGTNSTGPIPDQWKKRDVVIIKPRPLQIKPGIVTNMSDKGTGMKAKYTPVDHKLAGESTSIKNSMGDLANLYSESLEENLKPI